MKIFCFFILFFSCVVNCFPQGIFTKSFVVKKDTFSDSCRLGGFLDKNNTTDFQPMQRIAIENKGSKTVISPRLLINDEKNWYNSTDLVNDVVKEAQLQRDSLLSIWKFVRNNRVHKMPATLEDFIFYKMLTVFGYGTCDVASFNVVEIARRLGFVPSITGSMTHHVISEVYANGSGVILDSDIEVFYLKYNNHDLAGTHDVLNDKFLMSRTSHYGKSRYDKNIDRRNSQMYHNVRLNDRTIQSVDNFDFYLKPHESIEFSWKQADKYHHYWEGDNTLEASLLKDVVSNSKYIFSPDFNDTTLLLGEIFSDYNDISLDKRLKPTQDSASFIYRSQLSFPILSSTVSGIFQLEDSSESIQVFISFDNELSWTKVWEKNELNFDIDTFDLSDYLAYPANNQNDVPTYSYSLKFLFCLPEFTSTNCGIDSLRIENTFQISKFFLPQLKLGKNLISYTDANKDDPERNIKITIEWQESYENNPPNKITSPIFPTHQSDVDSLYFAFTWEPATDDDSDEIVDYEFMLSNDDRMLYPHSPNFNLYVSAFGESIIRPYFKVKETGWLNDGEAYYWRVRAKDARGAWSEWSDTWSFTPHGVMRPINGQATIEEQSIRLSWERNPTGIQPDYYRIYASDEMNGFSPEPATFFAVSDTTHFVIAFEKDKAPKSFYRISACDIMGQESLISEVITIPYPYIYSAIDSLRPGEVFEVNLLTNKQFYVYYESVYQETEYIPIVNIEEKPQWLNYTPPFTLFCNDTSMARRLPYLDLSQRTVLVSMDDGLGGFATQKFILQTTLDKPVLFLEGPTEVYEKELYEAFITSIAGGISFFDIIQKPEWLQTSIQGDTIWLYGIPYVEHVYDTLFVVKAMDTSNKIAIDTFCIKVKLNTDILSVPEKPEKSVNIRIIPSHETGLYKVEICLTEVIKFQYQLFSITGHVLYTSKEQTIGHGIHNFPIDIRQYPPGVYIFLGIENGKKETSLKIVR